MLCVIALVSLVTIAQSVRVGTIADRRVLGRVHHSTSNVSREQCICDMIEANLFAANYYHTYSTCEAFSYNGSSVSLQLNVNCSFIFVNQSSMMVTSIQSAGKCPTEVERTNQNLDEHSARIISNRI